MKTASSPPHKCVLGPVLSGLVFVCLLAACKSKLEASASKTGPSGETPEEETSSLALDFKMNLPSNLVIGVPFTVTWDGVAGAVYDIIIASDSLCTQPQIQIQQLTATEQTLTIWSTGKFYICLSASLPDGNSVEAQNSGHEFWIEQSPGSTKDNTASTSKEPNAPVTSDTTPPPPAELPPVVTASGFPAGTTNITSGVLNVSGQNPDGVLAVGASLQWNAGSVEAPVSIALPILFDTAGLPDGNVSLCLYGVTANGTTQTTPTCYGWIKDTTAPSAVLSGVPANPSFVTTLAISVGGTDVHSYRYALGTGVSDCSGLSYSGIIDANTNIVDPPGASGSKLVCVYARDQTGNEQLSPTMLSWEHNEAPSFTFIDPTGNDDTVEHGQSFLVSWNDADVDNDAQIDFYAKANTTGPCTDGILMTSTAISEDDATNQVYISSATLSPATYYICALVQDGVNTPLQVHSDTIIVERLCAWNGNGTDWNTPANWTNCNSSVPGNSDWVVINNGTPNDPVLNTSGTVRGFGHGTGGATLTINTGVSLTVTRYIASSVVVVGNSATCTTCKIRFMASHNTLYIKNNATLTLGKGSHFELGGATYVHFGDGSTAGHFATAPAALDPAEWPQISGPGWRGWTFNGQNSAKSSVNVDGLKVSGMPESSYAGFDFVSNYHIASWQNVDMSKVNGGFGTSSYMRLQSCATAVFDDLTWDNIVFNDISGTNVTATGTCAGASPITINGSGPGFGPGMESDAAGIVNWGAGTSELCVWNGGSAVWNDPSNWNSCTNGRGNYPDANDMIVIPNIGTPPLITTNVHALEIGLGTGGGNIVLDPGGTLTLVRGRIRSSISFTGGTTTCSTCAVSMMSGMAIQDGATLTLNKGVQFKTTSQPSIGNSVTSGHLVANGGSNSAEWPRFMMSGPDHIWFLTIRGTAINHSTVSINGLYFQDFKSDKNTLDFIANFDILQFDNVSITTPYYGTMTGNYIRFGDCTNAGITDTNWDNITFASTTTTGKNISANGANCNAASGIGPIAVTGGGPGFGELYESDPNGIIDWP